MNWHEYFINLAAEISTKSKDPSTKVGCVIVDDQHAILSTGYNGFARGVNDAGAALQTFIPDGGGQPSQRVLDFNARWERPEKYEWVIHAEHNAILQAARTGRRLEGATLYIQYDCPPCSDCCDAIIQAGIRTVISGWIPFPGKGKGEFYDVNDRARTKLREADVLWKQWTPGAEGDITQQRVPPEIGLAPDPE